MDKKLNEIIVCPVCHGKLDLVKNSQAFLCRFDRLLFSTDEGIPVLLAEKAQSLTKQQVDDLL